MEEEYVCKSECLELDHLCIYISCIGAVLRSDTRLHKIEPPKSRGEIRLEAALSSCRRVFLLRLPGSLSEKNRHEWDKISERLIQGKRSSCQQPVHPSCPQHISLPNRLSIQLTRIQSDTSLSY